MPGAAYLDSSMAQEHQGSLLKREDFGRTMPFAHFDLGLDDDQRELLGRLDIGHIAHFERYGDFPRLNGEIASFLHALGNNPEILVKGLTSLIRRIIDDVIKFTGTQTAWVTLRAFKAMDTFKQPRWHADRYDYPPNDDAEQLKAVITLKGDGTVFYPTSSEQRKSLEAISQDREALAVAIQKDKTVSAQFGEGTIFSIGAPHAPFHTEPDTRKDRLILIVVPGSIEQVRTLYLQTPEYQITSRLIRLGYYVYFVGPRPKIKFSASPYEDTEFMIFNLSPEGERDLYELCKQICKQSSHDMSVERDSVDPKKLRFVFAQGGIISIIDISAIVTKDLPEGYNESNIIAKLEEFAKKVRDYDIENRVADPAESRGFAFNPILGTNISGLFRPIKAGAAVDLSQVKQPAAMIIGPHHTFQHFKLSLTDEVKAGLQSVRVSFFSHYENYGDFAILVDEITRFVSSLGSNDPVFSLKIAEAIKKLAEEIVDFTGHETAWITLRAFTPLSTFDQPRWHADGYYYPKRAKEPEQYKVSIALTGPSTIFYDVPLDVRMQLEKDRTQLSKVEFDKKIDPKNMVTCDSGCGSVFVVGSPYAPIHSEPSLKSPRLFLSMIPGSREDIQKLYEHTPEHIITNLLTENGYSVYFVGPRFRSTYKVAPYENTELIIFKLGDDIKASDEVRLLNDIFVTADHIAGVVNIESKLNLLRVNFKSGAIITLNIATDFFREYKSEMPSDEMIFEILQLYSTKCQAQSPELSSSLYESLDPNKFDTEQHGFGVFRIIGRNTAGLFRPSDQNDQSQRMVASSNSSQTFSCQ